MLAAVLAHRGIDHIVASDINPPGIPARPTSAVEQGVYDPGSSMLRGFLDGLTAHLQPGPARSAEITSRWRLTVS